jgi:hypothetical protein
VIDSTPPATAMSYCPVITRWAAVAIASRPELQNRPTVTPGVVTGSPARSAACRAMLPPVAPSGFAQPSTTSSMRVRSTPARSMAADTA